ncbi:hypothetical protein [Mycobacterium intracellulare]|uniref:hypothetical protein n=1 Tax=Mycobacterium intracellulare TaxID=1767 RepID=UPI0018E085A2|nr:hypothetical protein [Mycobacterium intracellulare]
MTASLCFPPGLVTPLGDARARLGVLPEISFVAANGTKFYLQGAKSPDLSCEDGFGLLGSEGFQAPFTLLDEQGARQDGITNLDTIFDPAVIKLVLEASGVTPQSLRKTVRCWISAWNPPSVGTLGVFTQEMGQWWMPVRQKGPIPDRLQQDPSLHRRFQFEWTCRGDNAFWQGIDSVSQFPAGSYAGCPQGLTSGAASGFCPLTNLGTRPVFPRFLVYGPGTFTLGNGANVYATGASSASGYAPGVLSTTSTPVTFGPLDDGQIALITTLPRLRSVVDVSPSQPAQSLNQFQSLIETLVKLVTNNNVPPLLQAIESVFGILPPQGPLYSLLNGRFTSQSAIAGKKDGYPVVTSWIPVAITGGNSNSKIVAAITPYRTWPW